MELKTEHKYDLLNQSIDISFKDLKKKIFLTGQSEEIIQIARTTFTKMQYKWNPTALIGWFDFYIESKDNFGCIYSDFKETVRINLRHSITFLKQAQKVMVFFCTIGPTLDKESAAATSQNNLLEAYILDLIGLVVLDKMLNYVKTLAENKASDIGWGVGPLLSPGSVHGWDLEEQAKLCKLIPIDKINVTINNNFMLFPLNTITALIGIGPDYETDKVGTTCDVCSKKRNCQMIRHNVRSI